MIVLAAFVVVLFRSLWNEADYFPWSSLVDFFYGQSDFRCLLCHKQDKIHVSCYIPP